MAIRQTDLDSTNLRGGDMGMEREEGDRENGGKIPEMGSRSGWQDARIYK